MIYDCSTKRLSFIKTGLDEKTIIDTEGGQTINGNLSIGGMLSVKKQVSFEDELNVFKKISIGTGIELNSGSESTFTNDIKAKSFIANSARSLKTDIRPTKYNAIDEINKIEVVDFYFKSDNKKENPKVGFIADDTDPIFSTKEKNSMDLYNTCGMLLKAVQELSAENKELRKRIEKLEK